MQFNDPIYFKSASNIIKLFIEQFSWIIYEKKLS